MMNKIITRFKHRSFSSGARRKKVLVLEGGGMRGVFPTGVLQAFWERGYFPWEHIIGSSAGALTGTAYASGQIYLSRDAFLGELLTGQFINVMNLFRPEQHILNLDWMITSIINGPEPLNRKKLSKSCPVHISATRCDAGTSPRTVYFNSRKDDLDIALKATAAIPVLYRGFVEYKGMKLLDGGLLAPIPFYHALEMGYKDDEILVITTRPRGYRKEDESFWVRKIYENYYHDKNQRALLEILDNRFIGYNRVLDELENIYTGIDVIYPPADYRVNRLSQDIHVIVEGLLQGIGAGRRYITK